MADHPDASGEEGVIEWTRCHGVGSDHQADDEKSYQIDRSNPWLTRAGFGMVGVYAHSTTIPERFLGRAEEVLVREYLLYLPHMDVLRNRILPTLRRWLTQPVFWVVVGTVVLVAVVGTIVGIGIGSLGQPTIYSTTIQAPKALQAVTVRSSPIVAMRQQSAGQTPLIVYFPATGAATTLYANFERTAAAAGYHVIAMPYANLRTERSICLVDMACYGAVRAEQLNGDATRYLPVAAQRASVKTVLPSVLLELAHKDPNGNWKSYVSSGAINWANTVVVGHSQGGGLAAYIAHQHAVKGVIMFSSPNDTFPRTKTVATWLTAPSATPISRYYGLFDTRDSYAQSTTAAWHAMLPGVGIIPTDTKSSFSGQLLSTSNLHSPDRLSAHFAVARDTIYKPMWQYLLGRTL